MSPQSGNVVKDVNDANKIATETMNTAGYYFYQIQSAKKDESTWIVLASSLLGVFRITIDAASGEVLEFERTN